MEDLIPILINIGIFGFLLFLGIFVGGAVERKHLKSLDRREEALRDMLVTDLKSFAMEVDEAVVPAMVIGEAVISTDYLKTLLSKLRKLIGGEMRSYETLSRRARREAVLRVMEDAQAQGYDAVCNLRLESAAMGDPMQSKNAIVAVGVLASATAYRMNRNA